jgi:DDE_Tnp_1-associated
LEKKMHLDLVKFLGSIPDARRRQGIRYPQDVVILMILMAILSQHTGFRGYARFMKANEKELVELFDLKHGVPSHVTIRSIVENISIKALTKQFIAWMSEHIDKTDDEFVSSDGKVLRSILESGNDYLVQVKQNCPTLYKNLMISTQTYEIIDSFETFDRQKGRDEYRYYEVHGLCEQTRTWLDKNGWNGIQRIIKVHRYILLLV